MIQHFLDRREIILQVCINAHDCVARCAEQASEHCILVATVSRELDPYDRQACVDEAGDKSPGTVRAPIVHQVNTAVRRDFLGPMQPLEERGQAGACLRQYLSLVIAGHHNCESGHLVFHARGRAPIPVDSRQASSQVTEPAGRTPA